MVEFCYFQLFLRKPARFILSVLTQNDFICIGNEYGMLIMYCTIVWVVETAVRYSFPLTLTKGRVNDEGL